MLIDNEIEKIALKYNIPVKDLEQYIKSKTPTAFIANHLVKTGQDQLTYLDRIARNYANREITSADTR